MFRSSSESIRQPAVAGLFYPEAKSELQQVVEAYLAEAPAVVQRPKALIVPHAGYIYSGPIAATAYAALLPWRDEITRVVLLGPNHRVPLRGIAASSAAQFRTPLGDIPLDTDAVANSVNQIDSVDYYDLAHQQEHSLEVHLPFLQSILPRFTLLPYVVGQASEKAVSYLLELLWGGLETLIVVSSDLSHYHSYDEARAMDAATASAIEHCDSSHIDPEHACGAYPVRGLLRAAKRHDLKITTADLRNSGDTAGDRRQVVGYGAWLLS